eukprot:s1159_g3.t1
MLLCNVAIAQSLSNASRGMAIFLQFHDWSPRKSEKPLGVLAPNPLVMSSSRISRKFWSWARSAVLILSLLSHFKTGGYFNVQHFSLVGQNDRRHQRAQLYLEACQNPGEVLEMRTQTVQTFVFDALDYAVPLVEILLAYFGAVERMIDLPQSGRSHTKHLTQSFA